MQGGATGQESVPLRDFAVAAYGAAGVAEACIFLQDAHGIDVPLLLFAAWLA